MNIAIIGAGYVGLTSAAAFAKLGHTVWAVDRDKKKIAMLALGKIPFYEPDLPELVRDAVTKGTLIPTTDYARAVHQAEAIFICVGTPPLESGEPDLSQVFDAAENIAKHLAKYTVVVNKSTVPVGTTEKAKKLIKKKTSIPFDVASNPEFLREGSAVADSLHPFRIILGVTNEKTRNILLKIHARLPGERVITDIRTAEIIKYASNAFLATKISFINEMANLCGETRTNVDDVARGMGLDPRIGPGFLKAGIGYGGSCFPKDTKALRSISSSHSYNFKLLKAVIEVNQSQRRKFLGKVRQVLGDLKGKHVGIFGLAFKNNTDDVRESAALDIASWLLKEGAKVIAYDPKASANAKKIIPKLAISINPKAVTKNADAVLILTEWPEFKELSWTSFRKNMRKPVILDGRNLLNPLLMRKLGYVYYSIGRP